MIILLLVSNKLVVIIYPDLVLIDIERLVLLLLLYTILYFSYYEF